MWKWILGNGIDFVNSYGQKFMDRLTVETLHNLGFELGVDFKVLPDGHFVFKTQQIFQAVIEALRGVGYHIG